MGNSSFHLFLNEKEIVSTFSNKGLYVGEQDAEELAYCIINPETRNINNIAVSDIEKTNKMFEIFMGKKVEPRRQWIIEHSEEAQDINYATN